MLAAAGQVYLLKLVVLICNYFTLTLASRRSGSGLSSRTGSGFSPVPEHNVLNSPLNSANRNMRGSKLAQLHNSAGSNDSGFGQITGEETE